MNLWCGPWHGWGCPVRLWWWSLVKPLHLSFWPCYWSSDCDRPEPPEALGKDLYQQGINFLNASCALTILNFPTIVSTDVPKSSEGETRALRKKKLFFLPDFCQIQPQMSIHFPHSPQVFVWRAKSTMWHSSATNSGVRLWPWSWILSKLAW